MSINRNSMYNQSKKTPQGQVLPTQMYTFMHRIPMHLHHRVWCSLWLEFLLVRPHRRRQLPWGENTTSRWGESSTRFHREKKLVSCSAMIAKNRITREQFSNSSNEHRWPRERNLYFKTFISKPTLQFLRCACHFFHRPVQGRGGEISQLVVPSSSLSSDPSTLYRTNLHWTTRVAGPKISSVKTWVMRARDTAHTCKREQTPRHDRLCATQPNDPTENPSVPITIATQRTSPVPQINATQTWWLLKNVSKSVVSTVPAASLAPGSGWRSTVTVCTPGTRSNSLTDAKNCWERSKLNKVYVMYYPGGETGVWSRGTYLADTRGEHGTGANVLSIARQQLHEPTVHARMFT